MSEARVLSSSRDLVGECPVWDVAAQALYWIDIEGRSIRRWDHATGEQLNYQLPERIGCIAISSRGGLVAALETGVYAVELLAAPEVRLHCLATISHPAPGMRFNDGRCDAQGRFWLSTMVMDTALASPLGAWYCLDQGGLSVAKLSGLITPNGLAFSPDGRTAYFSDSHPSVQCIWACDFDAQNASLGNRRQLVDMTPLPGRPDGAAVDVDGHYWICGNDAGLVHCFSPRGELLRSLPVPVTKPSMCAFGGPDLDQLYVTSIQPASVSAAAPGLNGAVFVLDPGVRGLPEPVFSAFP